MPSSRGIRAGKAFVEIGLDQTALLRGLKSAQRRLQRFGAGMAKIGGLVTGVASSLALGFVPAIRAASDLQEVQSKFNTVFGSNAEAVRAWGNEYAKTVGRSRRQIEEFLAGSQDLFVPLGFEPGAAETMSKQITELAVDLGSFNNRADADVLNDLQAALTGSGEVMKKYGVIVSDATIKQEALAQGFDPKNLTEQQKVLARLSIIMKGTTAAQGDAVRTGGSFANQMKRLKAEAENIAGTIGNALLPVLTPVVALVAKIAGRVREWAGANPTLIRTIAAVVGIALLAGVVLLALGSAFIFLGAVAGAAVTVIGVIGTILGALLSPIGLVIAAVLGIATAILYSTGAGADAIKWLVDKFNMLKDEALESFGAIRDALSSGDFAGAAKVLWAQLRVWWVRGTGWLLDKWHDFKNGFLSAATEAFFGVASIANNAWAAVQKTFNNVSAWMKKKWIDISDSASATWDLVVMYAKQAGNEVRGAFDQDFDVRAANYAAQDELAAKRNSADKQRRADINEVDRQRDQREQRITRDREAIELGLGQMARDAQEKLLKKRADEEGKAQKALEDARAELAAAIANTKAGKSKDEEADDGPGKSKAAELLNSIKASLGAVGGAATRAVARGSFSSSSASLQALNAGHDQRMLKTTERIEKNTRYLRDQGPAVATS